MNLERIAGNPRMGRRLMRAVAVLVTAAMLGLGLQVSAVGAAGTVTITRSELKGTEPRVAGNGALANHAISINPGAVVGTSDASGPFKVVTSPYSSSTCQVSVSDGSSSASAAPAPVASLAFHGRANGRCTCRPN